MVCSTCSDGGKDEDRFSTVVNPTVNLLVGDDLYHPLMVILDASCLVLLHIEYPPECQRWQWIKRLICTLWSGDSI